MFSRATSITRLLASSSSKRPSYNAISKPSLLTHQQRCLNVASRPSDLIGNTPLIDLNKILIAHGVDGEYSLPYLLKISYDRCNYIRKIKF